MAQKAKNEATIKVRLIDKVWLSNKEAQVYLGMSPDFFRALRESGELPFYMIGHKAIFYKKSDIDTLLEKARVMV